MGQAVRTLTNADLPRVQASKLPLPLENKTVIRTNKRNVAAIRIVIYLLLSSDWLYLQLLFDHQPVLAHGFDFQVPGGRTCRFKLNGHNAGIGFQLQAIRNSLPRNQRQYPGEAAHWKSVDRKVSSNFW